MRRQFLELKFRDDDVVPIRDVAESEERSDVVLHGRILKATEFIVFDKMPQSLTEGDGWLNLLIDGKKFFGGRGFSTKYTGLTESVTDFLVYVGPGQKFEWTLNPMAGYTVELLISYLYMDSVDAIYAERLVGIGIVVNMSNVNWYRRVIIEGGTGLDLPGHGIADEGIGQEANRRALRGIPLRGRFDYNGSDFDVPVDEDGDTGFRRLNIRD